MQGKLEGTQEVEGNPKKLTWIGVRPPKFKTLDPHKLMAGKPIELFIKQGTRPSSPAATIN